MPPSPSRVYRLLLRRFGPQGWWPVAPAGKSRPEYRPGRFGAPLEREALEISVGAILTQNTSWSNVEKAVEAVHRQGAMRLDALLRLPRGRLERLIRPSGYFRQKAGRLRTLLGRARSRGGFKRWLSGRLDRVRKELLSLPGIGPETADSILLYAAARPAFVVDAYTLRIGERLGWFSGAPGYEEARRSLSGRLPRSAAAYQEFHALMVALAKYFCRKEPLCRGCPLCSVCRRGRSAAAAAILAGLACLAGPPKGVCAAPASSGSAVAARKESGLSAAAGKADISPDVGHEAVWLAGYGLTGRRARGVHDPLFARAVVVSDGRKTVALVGADSIGVFRADVLEIRRRLGWDGKDKYLFLASSHDHSSPDMLGLWGRFPGVSGVDARYHERVLAAVTELVRGLSGRLEPARLLAARDFVAPQGLCRDSRDPVVIDPELQALRFEGLRSGRAVATVVRWSCHAEALGRDNFLATADFPGALCAKVERETGGACVFLNGVIGGLLTPDVSRSDPAGDFREMERVGGRVADLALEAIRAKGEAVSGAVSFKTAVARVPVENSTYLLFLGSLAFGHAILGADGRPLTAGEIRRLPWEHVLRRPLPERLRPWIETEASVVRIGPVSILGIPGELFPELAIGGYDGRYRFGRPLVRPDNPNPPDLSRAPKGPYLRERLGGKFGMLVGLANDELGYIVPDYDFKANPGLVMAPRPKGDHYEETNSIGPSAAGILLKAFEDLLKR